MHVGHPSSRKSHGPGHKWCGMGLPREWEEGEGRIEAIAPHPDWVKRRKAEPESPPYRPKFEQRLERHIASGHLVPGVLAAKPWSDESPCLTRSPNHVVVASGDTVWCACGKDKAHEGRCHLAWTVPFLVRSGWTVLVFGERHPPLQRKPQLGLFA